MFYIATDAAQLWVTDGTQARAVGATQAVTGVEGNMVVFDGRVLLSAGGQLLLVEVVADMASPGAATASVATLLGSGFSAASQPKACATGLYFYATKAGARALYRVANPGETPIAVAQPVAAEGAPACVYVGAALISASGAVHVYDAKAATVIKVAPALAYAGASALTYVWSGLCFSAITTVGQEPEIVCAGVSSGGSDSLIRPGDWTAVRRSSAVGISLGSRATWMLGHGRLVITGCILSGAGGPHLCAWDGESGQLAWSTKDASQNLRIPYNSFRIVGSTLYFAAQEAGAQQASLWLLAL